MLASLLAFAKDKCAFRVLPLFCDLFPLSDTLNSLSPIRIELA